jgi:cob(I)alamin adenosyltransferase
VSEKNARGLIMTFTGNGKGKTTAALGMALRALGQGMRVIVLQFIKGGREYGELLMEEKLGPNFEIRQMGLGFVRNLSEQQKEQHKQAAIEALGLAAQIIGSDKYRMVILDEVFYGIKYGFFTISDLLELLRSKPYDLH